MTLYKLGPALYHYRVVRGEPKSLSGPREALGTSRREKRFPIRMSSLMAHSPVLVFLPNLTNPKTTAQSH